MGSGCQMASKWEPYLAWEYLRARDILKQHQLWLHQPPRLHDHPCRLGAQRERSHPRGPRGITLLASTLRSTDSSPQRPALLALDGQLSTPRNERSAGREQFNNYYQQCVNYK